MSFEKVREVRLFGVTNQNSTVRLPIGDSSGGTVTAFPNPLSQALVWDQCDYILTGVSVAGGATGGSYSLVIETDALSIKGYTALPIAGLSGIGPNTRGNPILTNFHRSSGSPLPTHMTVTQDASGGGIWCQVWALAKQYRGVLGTPGSFAERCIAGTIIRGASVSGSAFVSGAGFAASQTVAVGNSLSRLGLHRIRLWDKTFYWVVAGNSLSGTHNVSMVGLVSGGTAAGFTFTIASTVGVNKAPLATAGTAVPLQSNFFGNAPYFSHLIWTVVSAGGVSDARVVVLAKTGKGSIFENRR